MCLRVLFAFLVLLGTSGGLGVQGVFGESLPESVAIELRSGAVIGVVENPWPFSADTPKLPVKSRTQRLKSLNIGRVTGIHNGDAIELSWEEMFASLSSIELTSPDISPYRHGTALLTRTSGESIRLSNVTIFEFVGHNTPVNEVLISRLDGYNSGWRDAYIKISAVKKILFHPVRPSQPLSKDMSHATASKTFASSAGGMTRKLVGTAGEPGAGYVNVRIEFDVDSAKIRKSSYPILDELAKAIRSGALSGKKFVIAGHADSDGANQYNLKLSQRRARSVKSYLSRRKKIPASQIRTTGYGESKPIAPNTTAKNKQLNRRVEVRLASQV